MGYVANRPGIKVVREGQTVELLVGDAFPEAPKSPNFNALVRTNQVVFIPDEAPLVAGGQPAQIAQAQNAGIKAANKGK